MLKLSPSASTALKDHNKNLGNPHHFRAVQHLLMAAAVMGILTNVSMMICSYLRNDCDAIYTMSYESRRQPCSPIYAVGLYSTSFLFACAASSLYRFMSRYWTCLPNRPCNRAAFALFVLIMFSETFWLCMVTYFNDGDLHELSSYGVFFSGGFAVLLGNYMLIKESSFRQRYLGEQGYDTRFSTFFTVCVFILGNFYLVTYLSEVWDKKRWFHAYAQGVFEVVMSVCHWSFWLSFASTVALTEKRRVELVLRGLSWGVETSRSQSSGGWTPRSPSIMRPGPTRDVVVWPDGISDMSTPSRIATQFRHLS